MAASIFKRLFSKRTPDAIGCIDFGTAFSKFAIVECEDIDELSKENIHPLAIGKDIYRNQYLLPSLLFVSKDAVLFGKSAEQAARRNERAGREAFTSPKQYLSTFELDAIDDPLPPAIDPTGNYTAAQLITLYLAFILRRAELVAKAEKLDWPPKLRIARPAWQQARADWGEKTLRRLVRHAFIMADTIGDALVDDQGVSHDAVATAFATIPDTSAFPDDEIFRFTENGLATVPEATAVAAASIRYSGRRFVVVADIGGGTSDFAAFMTGLAGRSVLAEIRGSGRVLRQAGDFLDMQMRRLLLEKAGLIADDPAARGPSALIRARQRELKEVMFTEGVVTTEVGDISVRLDVETFLADDRVTEFSERLNATFLETVEKAIEIARAYSQNAERVPIEIMPTGGGFALPMVRDMIANIPYDWRFFDASPDLFQPRNPDFDSGIRQLAVSIGGAVKDLPKETAGIAG